MKPSIIELIRKKIETPSATLAGWVHGRRDHGGLIFVDLRDYSGLLQLVFQPQNEQLFAQANRLRSEWVIEVSGQLRKRPQELVNPKIESGHFELLVNSMRILNVSETPPISIDEVDLASEDKRLRYRYLDLRRPKMQRNLRLRAKLYRYIRDFMEERDFIEVPTPILANSSPEGARDFLVPSRLHGGKFYALPQAPQQFKQLLMVGGLPRYYQIAPVFRDEDPRSDRLYGDFYQLDLEMAFVEDGAVIRRLFTPLIEGLIKDFGELELHQGRFVEMSHQQALEDYGSDKPDLRYDLKLIDLSSVFAASQATVLSQALAAENGAVKGLLAPAVFSRKQLDELTQLVQASGAQGLAYLSYQEGGWQGPLLKFLKENELQQLLRLFQIQPGQTVFFIAHQSRSIVNHTLGVLRTRLGEQLSLADPRLVSALWIIDFPFYEEDEETGQLTFAHNPFSRPSGDLAQSDKLRITADQFDLVLNGHEVCSGAVRNHDSRLLAQAFANLGYDTSSIEEQFGAMIEAFKFGAPPHAGCAFGLDRILMILAQESNIRELVAFPKNGSGVDVMMGSPSEITPQQKKDLGL